MKRIRPLKSFTAYWNLLVYEATGTNSDSVHCTINFRRLVGVSWPFSILSCHLSAAENLTDTVSSFAEVLYLGSFVMIFCKLRAYGLSR